MFLVGRREPSFANHLSFFVNSPSLPPSFQVRTPPDGPDLPVESKITVELIRLTVLAKLWTVGMLISLNKDAHCSANRDVPLAV